MVVKRNPKQRVVIVHDGVVIEVFMVRTEGSSARLGIQAPPEVTILRGEVYDGQEAVRREE